MRKMDTFIGNIENLDENQFLNIFKAHIYKLSDTESWSCLYLTDKFNEKKANLRREMNKLCGITDTNTDSIGKKK